MILRKATVRIPSKGKKIINIGGIDFFVREANHIVEIFLQDTGECILVSGNSRTKALQQLTERMSLVRDYIDSRRTASF